MYVGPIVGHIPNGISIVGVLSEQQVSETSISRTFKVNLTMKVMLKVIAFQALNSIR